MSEQQKPTGSRLYSDKVLASQGVPVVQTAGAVDKSSSPCWRGGELHMDVEGEDRTPGGPCSRHVGSCTRCAVAG